MKQIVILFVISLITLSKAQEWPECDPARVTWHAHPYSCTKFVLCYHGNPIERLCAPGLHFNRFLEQCMFPQLAMCDVNYACPAVDDKENPVFLPDESDCSRYFVCFEGSPISRGCFEGLWFDVVYNWCTVAEEVTCDARVPNDPNATTTPAPTPPPTNPPTDPPTDPPTTTTTEATTTPNPNTYSCPLSPEPTFHPHSRDCEMYFICINGVAFLRQCAPNMWFDIINRECQDREIATCISGTVVDEVDAPKEPAPRSPFTCPLYADNDLLLFPHETRCERYYVCKKGVAFIHICPSGQHYDVPTETCRNQSDAVCLKDM